ncbi:uncharacterized protein C8Q71DRAFT_859350 [Rhodofomes roseus]|uniref:Uncharacterized protein n=1 Tax=Rhodofomes roseus TaxID=34475 RepID=A0ABQ8KC52_9APHY|nr:uncharacterized protein C8Q71DRAFT_859350 [Rhodofomes roseus]KAH9835018.1 hypothetical protein C8Q71DRAFT_859350 [Rhodofomes roseus]
MSSASSRKRRIHDVYAEDIDMDDAVARPPTSNLPLVGSNGRNGSAASPVDDSCPSSIGRDAPRELLQPVPAPWRGERAARGIDFRGHSSLKNFLNAPLPATGPSQNSNNAAAGSKSQQRPEYDSLWSEDTAIPLSPQDFFILTTRKLAWKMKRPPQPLVNPSAASTGRAQPQPARPAPAGEQASDPGNAHRHVTSQGDPNVATSIAANASSSRTGEPLGSSRPSDTPHVPVSQAAADSQSQQHTVSHDGACHTGTAVTPQEFCGQTGTNLARPMNMTPNTVDSSVVASGHASTNAPSTDTGESHGSSSYQFGTPRTAESQISVSKNNVHTMQATTSAQGATTQIGASQALQRSATNTSPQAQGLSNIPTEALATMARSATASAVQGYATHGAAEPESQVTQGSTAKVDDAVVPHPAVARLVKPPKVAKKVPEMEHTAFGALLRSCSSTDLGEAEEAVTKLKEIAKGEAGAARVYALTKQMVASRHSEFVRRIQAEGVELLEAELFLRWFTDCLDLVSLMTSVLWPNSSLAKGMARIAFAFASALFHLQKDGGIFDVTWQLLPSSSSSTDSAPKNITKPKTPADDSRVLDAAADMKTIMARFDKDLATVIHRYKAENRGKGVTMRACEKRLSAAVVALAARTAIGEFESCAGWMQISERALAHWARMMASKAP